MAYQRRPITQAECDRLKFLRANGRSLTLCAVLMKRWRRILSAVEKRGYTPTDSLLKRPIPADFAFYSEQMNLIDLAKHYSAGRATVQRWARETNRKGLKVGRAKPDFIRPRPDDFEETYNALGWNGTRLHYRCGPGTLNRWRRECGMPIATRPKPAAPAVRIIAPPPGYDQFKAKLGRPRDMYGIAA